MTKKPLHSMPPQRHPPLSGVAFYILHSILILALFLTFFGQTALAKPAPAIIPCPTNLPCIQSATQAQGGAAIREYVLGTFGVKFLTGFLGLVAATSVIFIIIGGLQMHLAFGNDEAVGTAKKTLTWAIVGLVIAILSVGIVRIISSISL